MIASSFPWPPGAATGIGSLPGQDPLEAARTVFGELPDLPHLPELPARGPGADMIGRTSAMLAGLHVDLQPAGWRLVDRAGRDERRAASFLAYDLDAVEEAGQGYTGALKVQLTGPWTLAASLELPRGNRALTDAGAVRDLGQSLAATAHGHVDDVRRRLPGVTVVLQLDEPSLPAVLAGGLPTASGFGRLPAVEEHAAEDLLRLVVAAAADAGAATAVHCCADSPPIGLLRRAGATAVSIDLARAGIDEDELGELVDGGGSLWAGVVPALDAAPDDPGQAVRTLWRRLGLAAEHLPASVVVTPACGLAGASPDGARAAMAAVRRTAHRLAEDPVGGSVPRR